MFWVENDHSLNHLSTTSIVERTNYVLIPHYDSGWSLKPSVTTNISAVEQFECLPQSYSCWSDYKINTKNVNQTYTFGDDVIVLKNVDSFSNSKEVRESLMRCPNWQKNLRRCNWSGSRKKRTDKDLVFAFAPMN